jgi:hypothetical protein
LLVQRCPRTLRVRPWLLRRHAEHLLATRRVFLIVLVIVVAVDFGVRRCDRGGGTGG